MEVSRDGRAQSKILAKRYEILQSIGSTSDNKHVHIVHEDESCNNVDISSMIYCNDPIVEGCLRTLCTLVDRTERISQTAQDLYWPPLLLYAESMVIIRNELDAIRSMTYFLPFLRELFEFCNNAFQLFRNIVQQIRMIREMDMSTLAVADVEMTRVWSTLGELLSVFVKIDEITISRPIIRKNFQAFLRSIETSLHNPEQFNSTFENMSRAVDSLREIDTFLLCGNALRHCYEQTLGDSDACENLALGMKNTIKKMFSQWEKSADEDQPDKKRLLAISALSVYYHHHYANYNDGKLVATIFTSHKKIASFHLLGDIVFVPCQFLLREVADPSIFDKKILAAVHQTSIWLKSSSNAEKMLSEAHEQVSITDEWIVEVRAKLREHTVKSSLLAKNSLQISELFLKGIRLADTMTRLLKTSLKGLGGDAENMRMTKRVAYMIFDVLEAIKEIATLMDENWREITESLSLASQQWRCHIISLLESAKKTLRSTGSAKSVVLARESALNVAIEGLLSSASRPRLSIVSVALDFASIKSLLNPVDLKQLDGLLGRIDHASSPRLLAQRVTNCSFLLHMRDLTGLYWETLLDRRPSNNSIQKFCSIVADCVELYTKERHGEKSSNNGCTTLLAEHFEMVRKGLLSPICGALESDLRILAHKHLNVDDRDRLSPELSKYLQRLLTAPPLRFYDQIVDVGEFAKQYLEKTFYNLTIVAPHDAVSYLQMADLVRQKYNLQLTSGQLLLGGIDEICDIINITKQLPQFIAKHNYFLNLQMFIEKESPSRYLEVVSLDQAVKSLRKHGTGVLPTTINVVYQVLRKKLNVFHQFLSDEHIRAQLQRDIRYFEENREQLDKMYPMKRAEKFARSRRGVVTESGAASSTGTGYDEAPTTYMDKFRILITQIGNSLGFVRLMTSAASRVDAEAHVWCDSEAANSLASELFLQPNTTADKEFNTHTGDAAALARLRGFFETIRNQATADDFSEMLVDVFRDVFASRYASRKNSLVENKQDDVDDIPHLSQFYVVVPALTTSHVEHMMTCRQRLRTRAAQNKQITFSDDGFALGVAFLLSVLDLWPQFNSLNWFRSVISTLEKEKITNSAKARNDSRGVNLKMDRIEASAREYRLLLYTFQSARVFFSYEDDSSWST